MHSELIKSHDLYTAAKRILFFNNVIVNSIVRLRQHSRISLSLKNASQRNFVLKIFSSQIKRYFFYFKFIFKQK